MSDDISYRPELDGEPDPGEVVWAWVADEDDPTQGKDRPALLLAERARHAGPCWGASPAEDHDRDAEDEAPATAGHWTGRSAPATGTPRVVRARCGWTGC